jgi:hypothetical protein
MKKYARVWEGELVEFFETDRDMTTLFHPDIIWIDVTDTDAKLGDMVDL